MDHDTYLHVPVNEIRFSQDSVSNQLGDGRDLQVIVNELLDISDVDERLRRLLSKDYGALSAGHYNNLDFVSFDNRRLMIYILVFPPDFIVPVYIVTAEEQEKQKFKLTSKNGGMSVRIRAEKKKH